MLDARYRQLEPQVPTSMDTGARTESQPLLMTVYAKRRDDSVLQIIF